MTAHLGIDLDGLLPQIASLDEASGRRQERRVGDVPPSIALGRLSGEAPRLDIQLPIDARGSGLDQSVDSKFSQETGGIARLPVAYAWEMLAQVREGNLPPTWSWPQEDDATGSITPGRALAIATRDIQASLSEYDSSRGQPTRASRTLVVPNALSELQQDHLLRSLRLEAGQTRLLWRPVAAALAWIDRHARGLGPAARHLESIGCLLHLHLGAESWEATVLELVRYVDADGTRWLLPGRRLPEDGLAEPLRGWPARCLEQVAAQVLQDGGSPGDARRWNLLWASPWSHASLLDEQDTDRARASLPPWISPQLAAEARRLLADALWGMSRTDTPDQRWLVAERLIGDRASTRTPTTWMRGLRAAIDSPRLLGAVVTGPFAALPLSAGGILGTSLVASASSLTSDKILVEGNAPGSCGLLAGAAAEFSRRSALSQPTYLDTLPSVRMIAIINCEPEWINLLETDEPWVMGSQPWSKEPENSRFSIQKGDRDLIVSIHRGGTSTCRRVKADFESPAEKPTPVKLHVSLTPGQGAPRVEVIPADRKVFQGRSLTFDWTTAEDTGRTEKAELESVERVCPGHEPRIASHSKWAERGFNVVRGVRGIRGLVQLVVAGRSTVQTVDGSTKPLLRWIRDLLKEWDRTLNLGWATAVSSDCSLQACSPRDEELLSRFVNLLDAQILSGTDDGSEALRTMAAMSATGNNMNMVLSSFLEGQFVADHEGTWWAAGHCLQHPDQIRRMIEFAIAGPSRTSFKQLARALMFRRNALASTPPELAGKLLTLAARQARDLATHGSFQLAFQEAALLCAYLLRERIYHPEFAAPGSSEYAALELTFDFALRKMQKGARVMGGVIDKLELVKTILAYARSKGRGRLVVYAQDSGAD